MNKIKNELITLILVFLLISFSGNAFAKDDAGRVLAVKNKALIQRDENKLTAKAKQGILMQDTVSTMKASKAKMLFNDDSILTLGESSKVVIKEYVYNKGKGGTSVFNLLEGKMRSVVGKTKFQIHTPTAVAAARGTVILSEVGVLSGTQFATFICLEGEVEIVSADPGIEGKRFLKPGMRITVFEKVSLPEPVQLSSKTSRASSNEKEKSKEAKESKESKESAAATEAAETVSQTAAQPSTESASSSEPSQSLSAELDSLKTATEMEYIEPPLASPEATAPNIGIIDVGGGGNKTSAAPPIEQQPGAKSSSIKFNIKFP